VRFLNGWSLTVLLLVILPAGGFVSIELLQRHRYSTLVARIDAALREIESDVRMECVDPSNRRLEVATGVPKHPIRLALERELRRETSDRDRLSTWNLTADCDRHAPAHGLRMEFRVRQERRTLLRSPQVTLQSNAYIPGSLEPMLQRALQGVDVERYAFEY
jgi:hypothetical protein